jgi:hypothetical protein
MPVLVEANSIIVRTDAVKDRFKDDWVNPTAKANGRDEPGHVVIEY